MAKESVRQQFEFIQADDASELKELLNALPANKKIFSIHANGSRFTAWVVSAEEDVKRKKEIP